MGIFIYSIRVNSVLAYFYIDYFQYLEIENNQ